METEAQSSKGDGQTAHNQNGLYRFSRPGPADHRARRLSHGAVKDSIIGHLALFVNGVVSGSFQRDPDEHTLTSQKGVMGAAIPLSSASLLCAKRAL